MKNLKLIILLFGLVFICYSCFEKYDKQYTQEIVAFNNGSSVDGRWFLFGGYMGTSPIYKYLWKQKDEGIRLSWINSNRCTIYETDKENPHITVITNFWNNSRDWIHIFIPKNSVKYEYKLELKGGIK